MPSLNSRSQDTQQSRVGLFCLFALVSAFGIAFVAPSLGRHATAQDCDAVLGRYVELLVREHNPGLEGEHLQAQVTRSLARAREMPSFSRCPYDIDVDAVRCALGAPGVNELERCVE
jgi:hypothetical protein